MAGVALTAARKEATVGFASSSLGFPSASLRGASRRLGVLSRSGAQRGKPTNEGLGIQEATVGLSAPLRYGTGNPRIRVLQNPAAVKKNLARLLPDSV